MIHVDLHIYSGRKTVWPTKYSRWTLAASYLYSTMFLRLIPFPTLTTNIQKIGPSTSSATFFSGRKVSRHLYTDPRHTDQLWGSARPLIQWVLSSGVNLSECEADCSPPPSAEVKNAWTEHCGRVVNLPASNSGGPGFKSRHQRLAILRF
jgi:hypothetical protein